MMFFNDIFDDIFQTLLERKRSSGSGGEDLFRFTLLQSLTEITASDLKGLTKIRPYAFSNCVDLIDVVIPDGVTEIGQGAFSGCKKLKTIVIPRTLTHIGTWVFENCYYVEDAYYDGDIASLCDMDIDSVNGCPLTIADNAHIKNTLNGYCKFPEDVIIPDTVTQIRFGTLRINSIKKIWIGNNVKSIEDRAFTSGISDIYIDAPEGSITGSPWGATNATIHWNTPLPSEEE